VVHNAELLTSELVTNAIKHASGDITCRLWAGPDVVRLEVVDSSPAPPVRAERGLQADSGRGLRIVDTLATRWGAAAQEPGKYVWFELDARD
jgi:two-component sensor histidine kinase